MKHTLRDIRQQFEAPTLIPIDLLQEYATGQYLPDEPDPPGLPGGGAGAGAGTSSGSSAESPSPESAGPNSSTPPWP